MGVIYIYTLTDPITKEIRYVGKTIQKPTKRYAQHITSAKKRKTYVNIWIDDLLKDNLEPILNVVDHCVDCDWVKLESGWVRKIYEENKRLCNLTYIKEREERDPNLSINITTDNKIKKTCEEIGWLKRHTDLTRINIIKLYNKTEYSRCERMATKEYKNKKFDSFRFNKLGELHKEIKKRLSNDLEVLVWYNIIYEPTPKDVLIDTTNKDRKLYNKIIREHIKRRGGIFYNDLYCDNITIENIMLVISKMVNIIIDKRGWSSTWEPYKNVKDDEWMMLIN